MARVSASRDDDVITITLPPSFGHQDMVDFMKSYEGQSEPVSYRVDLKNIESIDSAFIGVMIAMRKSVGDKAPIHIVHSNSLVRKTLLQFRFDKKFTIGD